MATTTECDIPTALSVALSSSFSTVLKLAMYPIQNPNSTWHEIAFIVGMVAPVAGMLYITASRATALAEGIEWVAPSSYFGWGESDTSIPLVTAETDTQKPETGILLWVLHVIIFYASISMHVSLHLKTFVVALVLCIPSTLIPHDVFARNPPRGLIIYMVYLYTCNLVAGYCGLQGGLSVSGDAWINIFFNWAAFWSVGSSLWRFHAELERLEGREGHLKYAVDGFRGGIVHDTLRHLEGTTEIFVQLLKIVSLVDTTL